MKRIVLLVTILCTMILFIPTIFVQLSAKDDERASPKTVMSEQKVEEAEMTIRVYRQQQEKIEDVPLERYIVGVVASEMPANFELEALKAQALTARTYIVKQMLEPADIQLPEGAMVTDSEMHQVYKNEEELKQLWGNDYRWKMERVKEAVYATEGQVLTFANEPITATFFSTSNGYTENSEDYWQNEIPYLRSVASPWDESSPRFVATKKIPLQQFEEKLAIKVNGTLEGSIMARTDGGRVAAVEIGGRKFSGREVRDLLALDSSDFSWHLSGEDVVIETKGWGHGVGMSQYGADGMAKEGKTYVDIVEHYYQGVEVQSIAQYESQLTAKR